MKNESVAFGFQPIHPQAGRKPQIPSFLCVLLSQTLEDRKQPSFKVIVRSSQSWCLDSAGFQFSSWVHYFLEM